MVNYILYIQKTRLPSKRGRRVAINAYFFFMKLGTSGVKPRRDWGRLS